MEETISIHGDQWKIEDIREEVEWCRKEKWQQQTFVARDAVKQKNYWSEHRPERPIPKGGEIVPRGWDHEHCQICWWSIHESENPEIGIGFTNGDQWVCAECYKQFIEGNALGVSS